MTLAKYLNCLKLNWQMLKHCCQGRFLAPEDYARSYDRLACNYDHCWLEHLKAVTNRLLDELPEQLVDGDILDLGCGSGFTTARLAECYPSRRIAAVDISAGMLAEARRRCPRGDFQAADMLAFCQQRQSCSAALVVSAWAIGYSHPARLIPEVRRILSPGGNFLLVTNLADTMPPVFHAFRRTLAQFPARCTRAIIHHFPPSGAGLAALLKRQGFTLETARTGAIEIVPPSDQDILNWLLNTGILAGFAEIMPLHQDNEVRDFFRQELSAAMAKYPMAHHYAFLKGTRPC